MARFGAVNPDDNFKHFNYPVVLTLVSLTNITFLLVYGTFSS